ncbi:MAG: hypothetical protein Q8O67_23090 [Deltaproteobacteria bacterium]|nr:hypothetical protein [Deltaproteobacteria bacterium]
MIALLLAVALQAPAPTSLLPLTRGTTKSGVAVVVVAAHQSPWAVAQLHLRLDANELAPKTRACTTAWSALLADAGRKSIGPTGTIESRLTPDSLVLSFGVEAARIDDAIKAIDAVLRARSSRPGPTIPALPNALPVVDDVVDAAGARALFPGQPLALSLEGGTLDATTAKALGDAVTPDRLALVITGPDSGDALLARVNRLVTAPLPRPQVKPTSTPPTAGKTITEKTGPKSSSSLTSLIPARQDAAGLLVLASLLGGRLVRSSVAAGVVVDVAAADRVALLIAEDDALEQIRRVAAAAPPPEVTDAARERVLAARLSSLNDPARVAHALGQAILDGRPTRVEDEVASLQVLVPAQVSLAAAALAAAHVVVARTPGPEPAPPPPPKVTPPAKPTTTQP